VFEGGITFIRDMKILGRKLFVCILVVRLKHFTVILPYGVPNN
jgi:hypothetical protein